MISLTIVTGDLTGIFLQIDWIFPTATLSFKRQQKAASVGQVL